MFISSIYNCIITINDHIYGKQTITRNRKLFFNTYKPTIKIK